MTRSELLIDFVTIWVTVDPVGTLPVYLSVTKHMTTKERRKAVVRASVVAFLILAFFLFLGQYVLGAMQVELLSFQIAGGVILFLFAKGMIFENEPSAGDIVEPERDVAVFPLAMPSIATPGAILSVVVLTNNNTHDLWAQTATCGVVLLVLVMNLCIMYVGDRIVHWLGRSGMSVLSRVMGMILAAAAVQMVYSAVHGELGPG